MSKTNPLAKTQNIAWFFRELEAGTVDLSPDFQRKPVWNLEQSSLLIDTILLALPFPEIYLRSSTDAEGTTLYEVVDGQQRMRAITGFARGEYSLAGDELLAKWKGKAFNDLDEPTRKAFWSYEVVIRELGEKSDIEVRDLFRRLNINSMTLTDQELRHAKYTGKFISLMERIAEDEWWIDHKIVTVRQVRRQEDVEYISELFACLMAGPQDKKNTLDGFYDDFENSFPDEQTHAKAFTATRKLIEDTLGEDGIIAWNGKSDFYSLFGAFSQFIEGKPRITPAKAEKVRKALHEFRKQVDQAKRKDNTKVFSKPVSGYAEAVTRAASDLARRKEREDAIVTLIEKAIK